MSHPKHWHFELPKAGRPDPFPIAERWYPGVREHWEQSTSSRIYDSLTGVRGIVIHATAGSSSQGAMSVMKAHKASWHWLVPDEDEAQHGKFVWACAPERRAAWHVRNSQSHSALWGGRNKINHWTLGIELVNHQQQPVDPYSQWQVDATAEIVRYCWAKYPNLQYVFSHAMVDPDRRSDPGEQFPWDDFEYKVKSGQAIAQELLVAGVPPMAQLEANSKASSCCMVA